MALLFARSGLYADRAPASRSLAHRRVALPGDLRRACSSPWSAANTSPASTSSTARSRSPLLYVSSLRAGYEWLTGVLLRAAGYRRRAVLVGYRQAHRATSPTRSATRRTRRSRSSASSRPRTLPANGLRALGSLEDLDGVLGSERDRRGDHRRPRLPPGRGGRARRPVPSARRARAARAVDDGDPDPPRRVRAGPVGAAVRARPARVRGRRLRAQAHLRPRRRDAAARAAQPAAAGDRDRRARLLARAGRSSARCAAESASGRSRA